MPWQPVGLRGCIGFLLYSGGQMILRELVREIAAALSGIYPGGEARTVAREVVCHVTGHTLTSLLVSEGEEITAREEEEVRYLVARLAEHEPLQYVIGRAWFCGRRFAVREGVLIPRPETEELVVWIVERESARSGPRMLDIGTGSGCIAVSLALTVAGAEVDATDISPAALAVAEGNARSLGAAVNFMQSDILTAEVPERPMYDVVVSNPPYVMERERGEMERNVLDYEPDTALFVPDEDPLLFYRAVAAYARGALAVGGALYFEMNGMLGEETARMVSSMGFADVEIRCDMEGKQRMLRAVRC